MLTVFYFYTCKIVFYLQILTVFSLLFKKKFINNLKYLDGYNIFLRKKEYKNNFTYNSKFFNVR